MNKKSGTCHWKGNEATTLACTSYASMLEMVVSKSLETVKNNFHSIFVICRKNFLFCKTERGADAAAVLMTVIRTALRNGLVPERYLAWLFENSGKLKPEELVPWSEAVPASCKAL